MKYTKSDKTKIYFLNDKNIASSLTDVEVSTLNPIPSLTLLSSVKKDLSDNISAVSAQLESELSVEISNRLSADNKISNDITSIISSTSSLIENDIKDLSDNISAVSAQLESELSVEISNRLSADNKISNDITSIISSTSSLIENDILSTKDDILSTVNEKYVHLSGDTISFINIEKDLSVKENLIQGKDISIEKDKDIENIVALGRNISATQSNSFIWNGKEENNDPYTSKTPGSFSINTKDGINSFYIGDRSLSDIISSDVNISINTLNNKIHDTLSTISTSLNLSTDTKVSDLSNKLSTDLSDSIQIDTLGFKYNSDTHIIWLSAANNNKNSRNLSIDTTEFVKDRIVDHVEFTNEVLIIYWKDNEGHAVPTKIPISSLAKVYTEGTGIDITNISSSFQISVKDYDKITGDLSSVLNTVNNLSTETISGINSRITSLEDYKKELSRDNGIIDTISTNISFLSDKIDLNNTDTNKKIDDLSSKHNKLVDKVTENVENIETLNNGISTINKDFSEKLQSLNAALELSTTNLNNDISKINHNVSDLSTAHNNLKEAVDKNIEHIDILQNYANKLSGLSGDIPTLSSNIDTINEKIKKLVNYKGVLRFNKYDPDWKKTYSNGTPTGLSDDNLTSFFKYFNAGNETPIKSGNIYKIEFVETDKIKLNDPLYAADAFYDFIYTDKDNKQHKLRLSHNDYILVSSNKDLSSVDLSDLNSDTVQVLAGAHFYEAYQAKIESYLNSPWLSGNNNESAKYYIGIDKNGDKIEKIGHTISGDNYFKGTNTFDNIKVYWKNDNDSISSELSSYRELTDIIESNIADIYHLSSDKIFSDLTKEDGLPENPKRSDVLIVSSIENKDVNSAYVYDGEKWIACTGNVDADKVITSKTIAFSGNYTQIGNINKDKNLTITTGYEKGTSIQKIFSDILDKTLLPEITRQPSVKFTQATSGEYEVGTKLIPSYTVSFDEGEYTQFRIKDTIDSNEKIVQIKPGLTPVYSVELKNNDKTLSTLTSASGKFGEITIKDSTSVVFNVKATYNDGANAKNNKNETTSVHIPASSKTSTSNKTIGFRKMFYGSYVSPVELNSQNIRALTGEKTQNKTINSVNIIEGAKQVIIAVPSTKKITNVYDTEAFGTDIFGKFNKPVIVKVEGANGYNAIDYKVYTYTPATALGKNKYKVTVTNA